MTSNTHLGIESLPGRTRVNLAPGHSLMDWIRLGQEKGDLSGVGPRKKQVTEADLAQHNKVDDLWMTLKGKVYNITPYVDFHPGGVDELMRAAGKDGTVLFDDIHSWVNFESMLSKCLVGTLVSGKTSGTNTAQLSVANVDRENGELIPTYDWYQTEKEVKVVVYTKVPKFDHSKIIVNVCNKEVLIEAMVHQYFFFIHFAPIGKLESKCKVVAVNEKAEITFTKKENKNWESLGPLLQMNKRHIKTSLADPKFWYLTAVSNNAINHDTYLIGLKIPDGTRMVVPIGYHIIVYCTVEGMELARSYTVVCSCLLNDKEAGAMKIHRPPTAENLVYLMIKCYTGGAISPLITAIKPGEVVKISRYDGILETSQFDGITHLVMYAAGTGFTSMTRPIKHVLYLPSFSHVKVTLLFYNKTIKDILWKDQLEALCKLHKNFSVYHSLSMAQPEGWTGYVGRVSSDHIRAHVPKPSASVNPLVLVCGQYAFNDIVCSFLKSHGLSDKQMHIFSSTS